MTIELSETELATVKRFGFDKPEEFKAAQWAPTGNAMQGIPSQITDLLAEGARSWGYGYGPGWSMIFGSAQGDIQVEPGQWVVRYSDGTIAVMDELPAGQEGSR